MNNKNICIIGMGFVGLTIGLILAKKGFNVVGIEKNKKILSSLNAGYAHFYEPGIDSLLNRLKKNGKIKIFKKIPKKKYLAFLITVGTPLNKSKKIDTKYIKETASEVAKNISDNNLVILRSTVAIGTTRKIIDPILKKSKKKYYLSFCPERTLEGKALKELVKLPQIIGGIDKKSAILSKKIFSKITNKTFIVSDLETAEMIKLVDNANRDVFFAYSNEIANVCNGYGINTSEVIRIGKKNYPRTNLPVPGLVGGPCLEKDPHILVQGSVDQNRILPNITLSARKLNENTPSIAINYINRFIKFNNFKIKKLKILLCGLSFKGYPPTSDVRGSMAFPVIDKLKKKFYKPTISAYDPMIRREDFEKFRGVIMVKNLDKEINKSDIVIILNNYKEFSLIKENNLKKSNNVFLVYDFWTSIRDKSFMISKNKYYVTLSNHLKLS
jgi:UDP-N-acetyl-D-mannosaminuronic acid dehydrogenase